MNAEATTPESSEKSSTDTGSPPSPPASPRPWSGLGYEMVPGLANRIISRYLRGQRRNIERFFTERGLHESAERMRQIRLSRQGMMAKNRMFQEVLSEYARGTATTIQNPVAQAESVEGSPSADMVLHGGPGPDGDVPPPEGVGSGVDAGGGVDVLEPQDGGSNEPVIDE